MKGVIPFLWFENQAEEAARYYVGIFPDSKLGEIQRFPRNGYGPEGSVMTASFKLGDQLLVALNGNSRSKFSPAMSLMFTCANGDEAKAVTEKLAAGGGEKQPCGWLRDRYGVSWQIQPAS